MMRMEGSNLRPPPLAEDVSVRLAMMMGMVAAPELETRDQRSAAGDVIGSPSLAATGMEQARVAMCHAFGRDTLKESISGVLPSGVYTIPEVSMVGENEKSAAAKKIEYVIGKAFYRDSARGQIIGDEDGFLKLLFRHEDLRLIGVHAIGEHATELVHIGLMAMLTGSTAEIFNEACFNYPSLGDMYKYAAYDAMIKAGRIK
jgi:NAD(P) transhydrogenase